VLVVHGFPDIAQSMLPFAELIAGAGFRCLCPALPGFPGSAPVMNGDYDVRAVAADLLGVLDELRLDRVSYVGHDWGAEIGYPLVEAHPDRFDAFVSLSIPHPSGYPVRRSAYRELRSAWYGLLLAYVPGAADIARQEGFLPALAQDWSPGLQRDDFRDVVRAFQAPGVMEAVCGYYRAGFDAPASRPVIDVPTLILYGGQDGCIGPACHPDFSSYFPGGLRHVMLPGVGHWPHLEAPAQTCELVVETIRGQRS
jgi:pimeloyl-ACP methyl ester carboxylesterase